MPVRHGDQIVGGLVQRLAALIGAVSLFIIAQQEPRQPQVVPDVPIVGIQPAGQREIRGRIGEQAAGNKAVRAVAVVFPVERVDRNRAGIALGRLAIVAHAGQAEPLFLIQLGVFRIRGDLCLDGGKPGVLRNRIALPAHHLALLYERARPRDLQAGLLFLLHEDFLLFCARLR